MSQVNEQIALFDYAELDSETRIVVMQRTEEIKTLMRRTAQDIIDIGTKLIEVKARLGHGNFGAWLDREFGWSDRTARKFMSIADAFGNRKSSSDLRMSFETMAYLAAPSTPDEARNEAIARAEQGETITHKAAQGIVQDYKTPSQPETIVKQHTTPQLSSNGNGHREPPAPRIVRQPDYEHVVPNDNNGTDEGYEEAEENTTSCFTCACSVIIDMDTDMRKCTKLMKEFPGDGPGLYDDRVCPYYESHDDEDEKTQEGCSYCKHSEMDAMDSDKFWCHQRGMSLSLGTSYGDCCEFFVHKNSNDRQVKLIITENTNDHARRVMTTNQTNEWYTPKDIIDRVRVFFGGTITLDPASCEHANTIIQAERIYTIHDNGLSHDWYGNVWCNPPYGDETAKFVAKAIAERDNYQHCLLLLKAATDTTWFRPLFAYPMCFVYGRVHFYTAADVYSPATFPSVVVYIGHDKTRFHHVFSSIGAIMEVIHGNC